MFQPSELHHFLERVMNINILRMGGAYAGINGSFGSDNNILNDLKKHSMAFAQEYAKSKPDHAELIRMSEDIIGCLKTLQLTHTLSETVADKLIDELGALVEKRVA